MRILFSLLFLSWIQLSFAQDVKNVTLLDHWHSDTILTNTSQVRYSSCWAFVQNGKEYGIIGSTEGAYFFELTTADTFHFVDFVPGSYQSSQAITREYKNYGHYVYAACDEGPSSLQIIDVSYLPDSVHVVADLRDANFGRVHNLFVDSANALLYLCRVTPVQNNIETSMVPMRVYSLQNPEMPQLLWEGPSDIPEVHDVFVRDNLAILNCGFNGLRVYDFSNPTTPIYKNNLTVYPQQGYNHQGWLAPNNKTYVFADETAGLQVKKAELKSDYSIQIKQFFGTPNAPYDKTPHNIHCTNDFAFVAYYNDGLRIFDLRYNPPQEIGAYDTYKDNQLTNNFSMWGAWGIHALLPSQRILVSDRNNGFFFFNFDRSLFQTQAQAEEFSLYPNPFTGETPSLLRAPGDEVSAFSWQIADANGRIIVRNRTVNQSFANMPTTLASGIYFVEVTWINYLQEEVKQTLKWIIP